MEIKDILKQLREDRHLTQDELADRVMVTRQAVSRWETGETQPNPEKTPDSERRLQFDGYLSQLKHWNH